MSEERGRPASYSQARVFLVWVGEFVVWSKLGQIQICFTRPVGRADEGMLVFGRK